MKTKKEIYYDLLEQACEYDGIDRLNTNLWKFSDQNPYSGAAEAAFYDWAESEIPGYRSMIDDRVRRENGHMY